MNLENHPCFNVKVHKKFGRVHLPVAPRCNIQCKFCNRKFDCVNESRPGVTSAVLTPYQAMVYLDEVFKLKKNISVVGIAGPGDPFANPDETMETLRRVRKKYPEMILCLASNGLNIGPYLDELKELNVSHVTITVNAIDPEVGSEIYAWVRYNKRVLKSYDGFKILSQKQLEALEGLKERDIAVKVNSIIIPGINDHHMEDIAKKVSEFGIDILNCIPYYPSKGSVFENIPEPPQKMVNEIRNKAGEYVKQMRHCTRCRADAVGLLGEKDSKFLMNRMQECAHLSENYPEETYDITRPYVAVASMEGVLINQHLGEASKLLIYGKKNGIISLLEARDTPAKGAGFQRWEQMSNILQDCQTLLVSGIGQNPKQILTNQGIDIFEMEGVIDEAVSAVFHGHDFKHLIKRNIKVCSMGAGGGGCCA